MDKAFIAQGVANKLFATEKSLDKAIADASTLLASMVEARSQLGVAACVGNDAIARVSQTIATLGEARSQVVAAHEDLADVKTRIGIRTKLIGVDPKLPPAPTGELETRVG